MQRIPVCLVEYMPGGNTIWVHSPKGATVLRIKCTGKINVRQTCVNVVDHSDMMVQGDIDICIATVAG